MKSKRNYRVIVYLILLLMLLVTAWLRSRKRQDTNDQEKKTTGVKLTVNRNRGFDRRISFIEYTRHARCRMQCRQITQQEVEDIMKNGSVNYRKSDVNAHPCPEYALEGFTQADNQHVRIVFAQCDQKTKVVTCIDLDKDFECSCN